MAKKAEPISMGSYFSEFMEEKKLDKSTMSSIMEESFRSVIVKMFGTDENFDVIFNPDRGDCEIYNKLLVVADGEVTDKNKQISLSEAKTEDPDSEIGEEFTRRIDFAKFGRRAILNLRQTLAAKTLDIQKDQIYNRFKELEGELVVGEVQQMYKREILVVSEEGTDMILPRDNQIPSDYFHKGDIVRAVIDRVENKNNNPKIIISRTSEKFLHKLLEQEVPEVHDGLILVRAIARIPGERAKIAVESYDDRIDPVGACVGVNGSRIRGVVRELRNENIDVIPYTSNIALLIQRALSPAEGARVAVDEENKVAEVYLAPEEVSKAIGKGANNIKLAKMLTGYKIDVYRDIVEDEDDVLLDAFNDEIEQWIIESLKNIGLNTAKSVLNASAQELEKADLEEDTLNNVMEILRKEFED